MKFAIKLMFYGGLFFVLWGVYHYFSDRSLMVNGTLCNAKIISCTLKDKINKQGKKIGNWVYLEVECNGAKVKVPPPFEINDCPTEDYVEIVYARNNPNKVKLNNDGYKQTVFFKIILGFISWFFVLVLAIIYYVRGYHHY